MILAMICVEGVRASSVLVKPIPRGIIGAQVQFKYADPMWDGLSKTVVFRAGDVTKDVLDAGELVGIPPEVVAEVGAILKVGVYGEGIPTLWAEIGRIRDATDPSGDESTDPSLPVWAQLQNQIDDLRENGSPEDDGPGENGGYYTPSVKQPDNDTMQFSFAPSKAGMPAIAPVEVALPAGPKGDDYTLTDADKKEIAEMAAALVEVPDSGGNVELDTTLTEEGKAADAKATGDAIAKVSEKIGSLFEPEVDEAERNLFNPANASDKSQIHYNPERYPTMQDGTYLESAQYAFSGRIDVDKSDYVVQVPGNRLRFTVFFFGGADGVGICAASMIEANYGSWPAASEYGVTVTALDLNNYHVHIENPDIKTLAFYIYPNQPHTDADFTTMLGAVQVTIGNTIKPYRPYTDPGSGNGDGAFMYDFSRLRGLKLVTAGDSITAGEGCENCSSMDVSQRPTYGYLAKEHYGMEYLNIAMSGRTMADVYVNGVSRNGFAVERYLLVPDDTDVLTLWFGYNDAAYGWASLRDQYCQENYGALYSACTDEQKVTADATDWETAFLGDLNSTDTKTWSGAWNFVLNHFVVEKQIERIGVVIPYGVSQTLCDRLMDICDRYEVPYIKAYDAQDMPNIGYSQSATKVATVLRERYASDGLHPNNAGYERIARAYIPWIDRI